mmetsp:Transcript_6793/g.12933  ORF Transcript_6793/g.12933 Transcript_6793/m.12933 type:complete len:232 (+) Transcript_6793:104-799(+)
MANDERLTEQDLSKYSSTDLTELACCVCFLPTDRFTPCRHPLCGDCQWELRRNLCPLCRKDLPADQAGPLARASNQQDDDDSDDDGLLVVSHQRAISTRPEVPPSILQSADQSWQFQLFYSDDWEVVLAAKLREFGINSTTDLRYVCVEDCAGMPVNLAGGDTPPSGRFPLRFSAAASDHLVAPQERQAIFREMLARAIQPPDTSGTRCMEEAPLRLNFTSVFRRLRRTFG